MASLKNALKPNGARDKGPTSGPGTDNVHWWAIRYGRLWDLLRFSRGPDGVGEAFLSLGDLEITVWYEAKMLALSRLYAIAQDVKAVLDDAKNGTSRVQLEIKQDANQRLDVSASRITHKRTSETVTSDGETKLKTAYRLLDLVWQALALHKPLRAYSKSPDRVADTGLFPDDAPSRDLTDDFIRELQAENSTQILRPLWSFFQPVSQ